ncbi:MAG: hypothetical protein IKM34_02920 [Clostridia bacterium]|nr:hypothetical protein [Clostridia bacterium]
MKTVKHLSVLLAVLMVFSLAAACFTVSAEETTPEFSPCVKQDGPGTATTLGTVDYAAFVSARESKTADKIDYRFLLVADQDTFKSAQNPKILITFTKGGEVVKILTKDVLTELDIYSSVVALRRTYVAFDTCLLTGIVITDVPKDAWDQVSVTLADDTASLAKGEVAASSVLVEGYNGTLMPETHLNFYFEVNSKDGSKGLVYWFNDTYGGVQTVNNIADGTYKAVLTIEGVEYKDLVVMAAGRYLVINLEASGITGFAKGEQYTCSIAVNDADGNCIYYTNDYDAGSYQNPAAGCPFDLPSAN